MQCMAEVANLSAEDRRAYFEDLKHKRDRYSVENTIREEGKASGQKITLQIVNAFLIKK